MKTFNKKLQWHTNVHIYGLSLAIGDAYHFIDKIKVGDAYSEYFYNIDGEREDQPEGFINEVDNNRLKRDCYLEYNFYDNDGIVVRDSSGNRNSGVLIGDFGLDKADKDIAMGVDSTFKRPKIDSEDDGVF